MKYLIPLLLLGFPLFPQAPPIFQWATSTGSTGIDDAFDVAYDGSGNVYSTGYYFYATDFDPGPGVYTLMPVGTFSAQDVYLQKLDAQGNFLWAVSFGGDASDSGLGVSVDAAGNVYVCGYYQGTADFDPGPGTYTLSSAGSQDVFVVKFNSSGSFIWARSMGGVSTDYCHSISIDPSGNITGSGFFSGTGDYDPGLSVFNLVSNGANFDCFVFKLTSSGNFIYAKSFGGTGGDRAYRTHHLANGDLLVSGDFQGTADFDPGPGTYTLSSNGSNDAFAMKIDGSGNFIWAKSFGNSNTESARAITADASGDVYVCGYFYNTVDFDPGAGVYTVTSQGQSDAFLLKLNSQGNFVWVNAYGTSSVDASYAVTSDNQGNIYAVGAFNGTVDFDAGPGVYTLTSNGLVDNYMLKINSSGNFIWALSMGSSAADDYLYNIKVDASYNVYTSGYFVTTVDFDPGPGTFTLSSNGSNDFFVHKLSQCAAPLSPVSITSPSNQLICSGNSASLSVTATGTVNWYNAAIGGMLIGSGTTFITPTLSAGVYTFFAGALTCTPSVVRTAITVTVNQSPDISASTSNPTLCAGQQATLSGSGAASYTWNPGGAGTSIVVSPSVTTTYTLTGTSPNSCTGSTVITQYVQICAGVSDFRQDMPAKIYPNPTAGYFCIEQDNACLAVITNLTGEILLEKDIFPGVNHWNLESLSPGIYFLELKGKNTFSVFKVIKE